MICCHNLICFLLFLSVQAFKDMKICCNEYSYFYYSCHLIIFGMIIATLHSLLDNTFIFDPSKSQPTLQFQELLFAHKQGQA